jgi:tRNA A-37 threonylcarbamoyl transferase component Bud32
VREKDASAADAAAPEDRSGETVADRYLLEGRIGSGGMGTVYRARNTRIDRQVAIKFLHPALAANAVLVARFLREARAANAVDHPNVVRVLDVGKDQHGLPFLVQELLEGEDLEAYLRRAGHLLEPRPALQLVMPIIDALEAAHLNGVVHRDIKPENIFLHVSRGAVFPKLLDFGVSRMVDVGTDITGDGTSLGTPAYMPPEQVYDARKAGTHADIWALGVILFRLFSGKLPFNGDTIFDLLSAVVSAPIPRLTEVCNVDPQLDRIVERCLRRSPEARYPSACELARDLRLWLDGEEAEPTLVRAIPLTMAPKAPVQAEVPQGILEAAKTIADQAAAPEQTSAATQQATVARQQATVARQQATVARQQATVATQQATVATQQTTVVTQQARLMADLSDVGLASDLAERAEFKIALQTLPPKSAPTRAYVAPAKANAKPRAEATAASANVTAAIGAAVGTIVLGLLLRNAPGASDLVALVPQTTRVSATLSLGLAGLLCLAQSARAASRVQVPVALLFAVASSIAGALASLLL